MNHQTDTPTGFFAVAGHTRLFRREGGTYYLRAKVPDALRPIIGKTEIRKSLRTKTLKEALPRVKIESIKVDSDFAKAEKKLKGGGQCIDMSRDEMNWLVSKFFVELEAKTDFEVHTELDDLSPARRRDYADVLIDDIGAMNGSPVYSQFDYTDILDSFLKENGLEQGVEKGSEAYKRLWSLFLRAASENKHRLIDRLLHGRSIPRDFQNLNGQSFLPPPPKQQVLLGKYLDDYMAAKREVHGDTTPTAYRIPIRALQEIVGEKTPMHGVTRQHIEKVCEVLRKVPRNMAQRYPQLSMEKAIAAAERAGDKSVLSMRTVENYHVLISAIFREAQEEGIITENPAKSRKLRNLFRKAKTPIQRALFTPEELTSIFHAPLYTGCQDDDRGYSQPGPNVIRQGRFWVPLLALFHGLRSNEACQLYTEDVRTQNGIVYLDIRESLDDEEKTDKRIKNRSSWRKVPLHPELLKMGFMEYVEERRRDQSAPRLFPTLNKSVVTGRFSHLFSKWFGRFIESACGHRPRATFHSFRHHFRTALMIAGVSREFVEALGGWTADGSSEIEYRHFDLAELHSQISKIAYSGLDLSHLYVRKVTRSRTRN
jgi:integrase